MKMGYFIFAVLFFSANIAWSDSYRSIVYEQSPPTISPQKASGAALAIAMSQLSFDWSTRAYQAGVGLGSYDDLDSIAVGFGKRVDRMLINGSVGRENGKYGYGFSVNWHF